MVALREHKNRSLYESVGGVHIKGSVSPQEMRRLIPLAVAFKDALARQGVEREAEIVLLSSGMGVRAGVDARGRAYLSVARDMLNKLNPLDIHFLVAGIQKSSHQAELPIPVPDRPEVERAIRKRLDDPDRLRRVFRRMERYQDHILSVLERHGLPRELLLLPVVESSYNPQAISEKGAAGLWQLMPDTARQYGLKVNEEAIEKLKRGEISYAEAKQLDERLDPKKSTRAAARFLKDLYERFNGDLEKVLSAYNAGPNRVARILDDKTFWQGAKSLPEETRNYVPDFYAVLEIYSNKTKYALDRKPSKQYALTQDTAPGL